MDRFRRKPDEVTAYQWNGHVIENYERPPVPRELSAKFPGRLFMAQVGSVTHGGPHQWLPYLYEDGVKIWIKPDSWIVKDHLNNYSVLSDMKFQSLYEIVPDD